MVFAGGLMCGYKVWMGRLHSTSARVVSSTTVPGRGSGSQGRSRHMAMGTALEPPLQTQAIVVVFSR